MPSRCCVPKCRGNYGTNGPKVSTYKFPKEETLQQKWILAIRRKDFTVTEHSRVCELHFKESDFEREMSAFDSKTGKTLTAPLHVKRLKKGVIPSLNTNSKASKSTSTLGRETPEHKRVRLEKEQLSIALEESLKSASAENSPVENEMETSSPASFKVTEKEVTGTTKRKGTKRKGVSDKGECSSKAVSGFTGIAYTVQQSPNKNDDANNCDSVTCSVQIKEEKPWEEEYNYTMNSSSNSDTVKITSVQSIAGNQNLDDVSPPKVGIQSTSINENEESVPLLTESTEKSPGGCDTTFYKKPLKIDHRDEAFGKFIACEMSDLRNNRELYLKTQQSILKILIEAHFEQMCSNNVS